MMIHFLYNKIRRCLKSQHLLCRVILKPAVRIATMLYISFNNIITCFKKGSRFIAWFYPSLKKYVGNNLDNTECRILLLWDFRSQPYSVGDLLVLQEIAAILCFQYKVAKADICFLVEKSEPARPSFREIGINKSNYLRNIANLIPVSLAGKNIEDLHFFNNHNHFEKFIADNIHRYHIWPSQFHYCIREDLNIISIKKIIDFFNKNKYIPELAFKSWLIEWADIFLKENAYPKVPLVIQLRNAGTYNQFRNAQIDIWIEALRFFENKLPIQFLLIGSYGEVDQRIRGLSNVIVAKDSHTTVDQDLALIQQGAAFLGMCSGPCMAAIFNTKPYSIFNLCINKEFMAFGVEHPRGEYRFSFANADQKCHRGNETLELIVSEIHRLFLIAKDRYWTTVSHNICQESSNIEQHLQLR